jgi:hypothetical protein
MWLRDLFIALSLANLCYLRVWSELLTYTRSDTYLMKLPPAPAAYLAVMLNVLLVAGALWAAVTLARRKASKNAFRWVEVVFLLFLIVPLNAVRAVLSNHFDFLRSAIFAILSPRVVEMMAAAMGVLALLFIAKYRRGAARVAAATFAVLVPFCAVTFGQALWKITQYDAAGFAAQPPTPPLPGAKQSARVLWVIADEWDYRLTFVDRPTSLALPEIDRLRKDALVADQAYPPGSETPISMPAFFTGKLVDTVQYDGPAELQVRFHGVNHFEPWSRQPSVFTRARELGFNTALVDWFHPGCRVLSSLTYCDWWEMARQFNSTGRSFDEVLRNQTRSLFETTLLSLFGQSLAGHQQAEVYHEILREGMEIANNPEFGLAVVHLPIPHAPHAYDRRTGAFTLANAPIAGYIDSLALLDLTIGRMRRGMKASGAWDRTTVLFTSDHHYRESAALDGKDDTRIPFLLKLAAQRESAVYNQSFNAVLTHDLVLAILKGDLATAADAARWLDANRSRVPES